MGFPLAEIATERSATAIDIPPERQGRLLLQVQPVARRQGLRHRARARALPPARGGARRPKRSTARSTLHDSPLDPIADIPVGRIVVDAVRAGRRRPRTARSSSAFPPTGSSRSCTSATTTSRCSGSEGLTWTRPTSATRSSRPTATPGLPCEEYRPYLDARYHAAFDEFLAERQANRDEQMKLNYDYITHWETDARGRPARRVRPRAARQGAGRRRRRGRGDLPRRRRDHRHGVAAVRRRACRPG